MTDADLLQALRDCYDPLLRRNIVELNLVRSAHLALDDEAPGANISGVPPKYAAEIRLAPTNSDEGAAAQLEAQVRNRLAGLSYISRVKITMLPPVFSILDSKVR